MTERNDELEQSELEREDGELLPEREAMSIVPIGDGVVLELPDREPPAE